MKKCKKHRPKLEPDWVPVMDPVPFREKECKWRPHMEGVENG